MICGAGVSGVHFDVDPQTFQHTGNKNNKNMGWEAVDGFNVCWVPTQYVIPPPGPTG